MKRDSTVWWLLGGGCFALSVLGCVAGGGLVLWLRSRPAEPLASPSDPSQPVAPAAPDAPDAPGAPDDRDLAAARMRMRDRYRPGPHVRVEGMLPDGRLAQRRMTGTWRAGRTIDTPWVVAGAELRPAAAPDPTGEGGPTLRSSASGELTILAGVPARLGVSAGDGSGTDGAVQGLLIAFHDYPGHFFLPATVDTELGHVRVAGVEEAELHFGLDAAVRPDGSTISGSPHPVTMYVAAVDLAGRVSPYVRRTLSVQPVGSGDVEVTLTMSEATDLDLYVVDPTGVVVYYGNTGGFSGGQLDLDANAACASNLGVNNEHVFWAEGDAPAGTYTVRVANFQSCIEGRPVDYRVTVRNCGETVVLAGQFEGQGNTDTCDRSPGADRNWCQDVVELEVEPCRARGPTPLQAGSGVL